MTRYLPIPGWGDGYRVGDDGSVWTRKLLGKRTYGNWRKLKTPVGTTTGYPKLSLSYKNHKRDFNVHSLVLLAFVGKRPKGKLCRHLNGIPTDNNLSNLKWGTHKENEDDKKRHGRRPNGSRVRQSKLTESLVWSIRKEFSEGEGLRILADRYHIHMSTLIKAIYRRSWRHVSDQFDYSKRIPKIPPGSWNKGSRSGQSKLTEAKVREIKRSLNGKISQSILAKRFGVSRGAIAHIAQRNTWNHVHD